MIVTSARDFGRLSHNQRVKLGRGCGVQIAAAVFASQLEQSDSLQGIIDARRDRREAERGRRADPGAAHLE